MIIIRKLITPLLRRPSLSSSPLTFCLRQPIISNLFRKKNESEANPPKPQPKKQQEKEKVMEDEEYDFFERRKEIDTGFDFSKMRELHTTYIPEKLGEGGMQEVLYWSQSVSTPQQIQELVIAFNRVAEKAKGSAANLQGNAQMEQFKSNVAGSVYLVDSLAMLQQYAIFALRYQLTDEQFWQKMEFKCLKYRVQTKQEVGWLVDIVFVMGQFGGGEEAFNFAQKILAEQELNAEQNIKLFLVFSTLRRGEKPWIQKLLNGIADTIGDTDAQQLCGVLPNLKQAKKLPQRMNEKIQGQVQQLLPSFSLAQLLSVTNYFGFQHEDDAFWTLLERRAEELLQGKKIGVKLFEELVLKAMMTYRLSTNFIRKYIVPAISSSLLEQLPPRTLSSLSKGLYIYELEQQTASIEQEIGKLLIGKITQSINEITDQELVKVIQDYNLTRHGARELYIFFEEVVKVKFIRHYNPDVDRNTIELLISIYDNSGMCSREMLDSLHNLILE